MTERSASVMIQTLPARSVVGAEDPVSISQRYLVLPTVEGAQFSPVSGRVAGQVVERVRPYFREQFQRPWSSYNPPEGERRPHRPLLALKANLVGFEATFGPVTSMASPRGRHLTGALSRPRAPLG